MTKGSILQENKIILNVYVPNDSVKIPKIKLLELQGETDESTIIIGDFNTLLSEMDKSSRQKISKPTVEINSTINQLDMIDI